MTIYGHGPQTETPNRKLLFIGGVALVMALGLGVAYFGCDRKQAESSLQSNIQKYEHQIDSPREIALRR